MNSQWCQCGRMILTQHQQDMKQGCFVCQKEEKEKQEKESGQQKT